ncbi:MAG: copper transporter [Actinomycetota bacterium]
MISFRYHLVTIVAVFLALALGVLAGTTVIRTGLVKTLRQNNNNLEQQLAAAQKQVDDVAGFQDAALPWLTTGRLTGEHVVVISSDGADPAGPRNARDVLTAAGARTAAGASNVVYLTITSLINAPTPKTRNTLADALGESRDTPVSTLTSDAATRLAERLADGPPPASSTGTAGASPDLLVVLLNDGFIRSQDVTPTDASAVGGSSELFVVSAGGQGEPTVPIDTVMERLVVQMVQRGETVAAVQTAGSVAHPFVTPIRQEADLPNEHLLTVDDVDTEVGKAALVLGFSRMLGGGSGGDYGTGDDAQRLLPEVP